MTEQEAIRDIKRQLLEINSEDADITLSTEALKMAIKALEKQIAKKPNKATDTSWGIKREVPVCPVCDYYLTKVHWLICDEANEGEKVSYCETCGQAIDWE